MDVILIPFIVVLSSVIGIYVWIVIASVVMHWLVNFHVVNHNNNFVLMVMEFLYRATEPVLGRVRRFLPTLGGLDLSPFVVIVVLWFLQAVMGRLLLKLIVVGSV